VREHSTCSASEEQPLPAAVPAPVNPQFRDVTGQTFGRLTAIYYVGRRPGSRGSFWLCRCLCGRHTVARVAVLRNGTTRSCGCLSADTARERAARRNRRHGLRNSPEYAAWGAMIDRCHNTAAQAYHNYGARGIRVCDRWRSSFTAFHADMGARPSAGHSLDRIDNEGGYTPLNCRWATSQEQAINKRTSVYVEHDGRRLTVPEWSRLVGLRAGCIRDRLQRGWAVADALSRPARQVGRKGGP
jgi:hypothetical protein